MARHQQVTATCSPNITQIAPFFPAPVLFFFSFRIPYNISGLGYEWRVREPSTVGAYHRQREALCSVQSCI